MDLSVFTVNCHEKLLLWSWDRCLFYWILVRHKMLGFFW